MTWTIGGYSQYLLKRLLPDECQNDSEVKFIVQEKDQLLLAVVVEYIPKTETIDSEQLKSTIRALESLLGLNLRKWVYDGRMVISFEQ